MASSSQPNRQRPQQADGLLATQKLLRATLDSSRDMIQVFEAVRNEQGDIIDFNWILNNHTAEKMYGNVVGKSLLQLQPGVVEEGIFAAFKQVVETGQPQQYEKQYVHEQFDGWFYQSVVKLNDGVATTTADITRRKTAEEQLQQSQTFLQSVIDISLDVIQVFKAVRDETGSILDFIWVMNNHKAVDQNGEVIGKSLLKQNPGVVATGIFDHMVEVAQTGVAYEHEQYYHHEQFDGWFYQALVKTEDGVAMTTRDISRQKHAEAQILRMKDEIAQKAEDKYRTLFETMGQGYAELEIIRGADGRATDVRYLELNPAYERLTGIPVVKALGRTVLEMIPDLDDWWIQEYDRIVRSGCPGQVENEMTTSGRWYQANIYPRAGERFSVLSEEITERKQHEQLQDYLLTLNDAIRPIADPLHIQTVATDLLGEQLNVNQAHYGERAGDYIIISHAYANGLSPMTGTFRYEDFGRRLTEGCRSGKVQVCHDAATDPELSEEERQVLASINMAAYVAMPFMKDGEWVATLAVHSIKPRQWKELDIEIIKETAERTWAAVERAKAEEALRESQERFESIANLVPDLLWDSEPDGSTNWYNQRWLAYTGQRFEQAIGWGWTDTIHPDDREASAKRYGQAVAAGQSLRQEHRIRRHDGVYRWFVVSASPLKDETGQVVKMYGAATDIHESKLAEEALRLADRRKDEFLAMLAHELRNPMSTLRSGLTILNLTITDELTRSTVTMMERQTHHLVRMVDDLLDVSRISRGRIELKTKRVDLVEVVSQAVESVGSLYQEQGKRLQLSLPEEPIYLEGNATRLTQVVTNLLTNGVRYTHEQGQVWLSLTPKAGSPGRQEAILQVRDNGIGLADDQLSAIFELFVQVDNSTARSKGGLGLGLTIVKRLVEMHGGRVEAKSEGLGKGSTFMVYLPTLTPVAQLTPKTAPQTPDSATAKRILVIDDNADAAFTLAMLLKLKGYETHTRNSGRSGIEAAESLQPAAILLDIGMPVMDGHETCRLIRQQPWGQAMVLIALTGYGQEEDRQRTKEAGFDEHLVKPVDLGALTTLLTDLLDKDQYRAGLA